MKITVPVAKVLAALLSTPDAERYGLDLMKATGLPSGTLYPILVRLEHAGWVEASWEDIDPVAAGRPARRYYKLSADGAVAARDELAALRAQTAPARSTPAQSTPAPAASSRPRLA